MEEGVTGRAAVTEAVVTAAAEEDEALERSPRAGIPPNDKYTITDIYMNSTMELSK